MKYLNKEGVNFLPSLHGYNQKNYTLQLKKKDLTEITQDAFNKSIVPDFLVVKLISTTLASGVCSGISAYVLQRFFASSLEANEEGKYLAVLQSRTWGRPFILESLHNYFMPFSKRLRNIKEAFGEKGIIFVFLPRILYAKNIYFAHTVVPYGFSEGLSAISISIYDSNYPGDDTRVLTIDKHSGQWQYSNFSSKKWVLTINSMENLTHKVSFLI